MSQILELDVELIRPDEDQPRRFFDQESLVTLSENIAEHGVLEPVIVRSNGESYVLIAGERRLRATRMAGLATIPAIVRNDMRTLQVEEVSISENTARANLNELEEARAFKRLRDRGLDDATIGRKVGRAPWFVAQRISLLSLLPELQRLVEVGQLGAAAGEKIAELEGEYQMLAMRALIQGPDISHNGFMLLIAELKERQNSQPMFTAEQVETRKRDAMDLRDRFDRAVQLAINAINGLINPRTVQLLPAALTGDLDFEIQRLVTLEAEIKRIRHAVESVRAQQKVGLVNTDRLTGSVSV